MEHVFMGDALPIQFYHEDHEDYEDGSDRKRTFVSFVPLVVKGLPALLAAQHVQVFRRGGRPVVHSTGQLNDEGTMAELPTVAARLSRLFEVVRHESGRRYTYAEVAQALATRYGATMNGAYLGKVCTGKVKNPGRDTILYLCLFFQVPAAYFFPELDHLTESAATATADVRIRAALQTAGLPPDLQRSLEGIIAALQRATPTAMVASNATEDIVAT